MGISLTPETETLARELAVTTHEEIDQAISLALQERLQRLKAGAEETPQERLFRLQRWLTGVDARPRTEDPRTWKQFEDEELYDEAGLPI